jgi:hypothetical protein
MTVQSTHASDVGAIEESHASIDGPRHEGSLTWWFSLHPQRDSNLCRHPPQEGAGVGGQQDLLRWRAIVDCPLTATSSRRVVVRAKQRLAGDAIHRHVGDSPNVRVACVVETVALAAD